MNKDKNNNAPSSSAPPLGEGGIAIINYGAGNIQSLKFAFKRLGIDAVLSHDADEIRNADKVIFPGVGHAGSAMEKLKATGLDALIPQLKQPVLGICLGMQLMCNHCEEGDTAGLGIFDVDVPRFDTNVKVPQIGWNAISNLKGPLFTKVPEQSYMYLVHSYYVPICKEAAAVTTYGSEYASALQKENFYGVQFHPEKSAEVGEQVLKNFCLL